MSATNAGLGLQNLVTPDDEKTPNLQLESTEFIRAMKGKSDFSTVDNLQIVKEESSKDRKPRMMSTIPN